MLLKLWAMRPQADHQPTTGLPHEPTVSDTHGRTENSMRIGRLTAAVAAVSIAAGSLIAGAGEAQAARISCYASSCNHLNPYKTTCTGDGYAVHSAKNEQEDVVYLYYSPSCRSVWAESWTRQAGDTIRVERSDGSIYSQDDTDGTHSWSGMINDAGYKAHAMISDPGVSAWGQTYPDF